MDIAVYAVMGLFVCFLIWLGVRTYLRRKTRYTSGESSPSNDTRNPSIWRVGPIVYNENKSPGTDREPVARSDGGWEVPIPVSTYPDPEAHIHYVTHTHGPLTGAKGIRMRGRFELGAEEFIWPRTAGPGNPALLSLYFQRRGDDWSGIGAFEDYRWYANFVTKERLENGEFEIYAPLDGPWTAVEGSSASNNPEGFAAAIADAQAVGFVLGGGDGLGHGVYATGPAKLVVTDFIIE